MSKKKTRNELIMENFLKRREQQRSQNYLDKMKELELKKEQDIKKELEDLYYKSYRFWGPTYYTDEEVRSELDRIIEIWNTNIVNCEDDRDYRQVIIESIKEIDEKEDWLNFGLRQKENWSDEYFEKRVEYCEGDLSGMYNRIRRCLSNYDLDGVFNKKYYMNKIKEMEKKSDEYQKEQRHNTNTLKSKKPKSVHEIKPLIKSKGSKELHEILKKVLPNVIIEEEHYLMSSNCIRLDFYLEIDDRKIGVEYQGIQHFEEVKYFGGIKMLEKQKEWDIEKRDICEKLEIELIYFLYNENVTEELVRKKLGII